MDSDSTKVVVPTLEKVWMYTATDGGIGIAIDWSNGRCHTVSIDGPADVDKTVAALLRLASVVGKDAHLRPESR